ncbi:hypothetical protein C8F01DRAFT_1375652 [Mycena amicta]|nr:hypothetical protein C8F01DRAFT_1375652 [Mycena amicta]
MGVHLSSPARYHASLRGLPITSFPLPDQAVPVVTHAYHWPCLRTHPARGTPTLALLAWRGRVNSMWAACVHSLDAGATRVLHGRPIGSIRGDLTTGQRRLHSTLETRVQVHSPSSQLQTCQRITSQARVHPRNHPTLAHVSSSDAATQPHSTASALRLPDYCKTNRRAHQRGRETLTLTDERPERAAEVISGWLHGQDSMQRRVPLDTLSPLPLTRFLSPFRSAAIRPAYNIVKSYQ